MSFTNSSTKRLNQIQQSVNTVEQSVLSTQQDVMNVKTKAQLTKITNDNGGVQLTTTSSADNILSIILAAGTGMRTFYAATGTQGLPPTNISIRGVAHFTQSNIGWVYCTDYNNNIFTNYYDATIGWKGWRNLTSFEIGLTSALNSRTATGLTWVAPNTVNAPTTNAGCLLTVSPLEGTALIHTFIDLATSYIYTRSRFNGVWSAWQRSVTAEEEQNELYSGPPAYPVASTTIPLKSLSKCRNGWIIVWSDYNADTHEAGDYDIAYSYIPKGTAFKNGHPHLFVVPNFLSSNSAGTIVKKLYVFDNKIVGSDDNGSATTGSYDVVIRQILEM